MYYIAEATDHIGFKSYLTMMEEVDEQGEIELLVSPSYNKEDAYKFKSREAAQQATIEWSYANLTWNILEVADGST